MTLLESRYHRSNYFSAVETEILTRSQSAFAVYYNLLFVTTFTTSQLIHFVWNLVRCRETCFLVTVILTSATYRAHYTR